MEKIRINKEIDLKDVLNIFILILGGVLTYCLVTSANTKNENLKTKQILIEKLADLYPNIKIKYANQLSENKDTLYIKVYIRNDGKYPVFFTSPTLNLTNKGHAIGKVETPNLYDTFGTLSPNQDVQIKYEVLGYSESKLPDNIELVYPIEIDENIRKAYQLLIPEAISSLDNKTIEWITNKEFKYKEKVYSFGENHTWNSFFSNQE